VQCLCNANFAIMDILGPLDFPDSTFDLVNARLIGFIPTTSWPSLIRECVRIARPGGVIRLCEGEWITNSPGYEKQQTLFTRALKLAGQSFSPDGRLVAITPMLPGFLKQGGCVNVKHAAQAIDFSAGTEENYAYFRNFQAAYKLMQPFLLRTGVTTEAEADEVYELMLQEMLTDNFRGIAFLLNAWGRKPEEVAQSKEEIHGSTEK
jgi:SAM-dependent methyltransferase